MSNATTPFGLRPVRHINGAPWNGQTIRCWASASYATALYIGDPVVWVAGAILATEKDVTAKHWTVNRATGSDAGVVNGVITSFEPNADNLTQQYRPASQDRWVNVCVATPDIVFQIRDDGSGTPAKVFVCQNATMTAGTASTITGISGFQLDASTPAADQSYPLLILGLSDIEDNELADYAIWDVLINTCYNATGLYLGITCT